MRSAVIPEQPRWMVEYARRIEHIRDALAYSGGTHDEWDVAAGIQAGLLQMFCSGESIAITELEQYPKAKHCHVFLAGGNLSELELIIARIEDWARAQGCTKVTIAGRRGWERTFLSKRNYTPRWYVMARDLEEADGQRGEADNHDKERDPAVGVGRGAE